MPRSVGSVDERPDHGPGRRGLGVGEAEAAYDDQLDYYRSGEVEAVAAKLIDPKGRHAITFGSVRDFSVIYLLRRVDGPMEARTIDALAKCHKAPALWRDVYGVDVAIWVDERYWQRFTERQREAVVMHELLHIGQNDAGKVKLLEHSVEEFGLVVATYGQWLPELERFAEQLALFEDGKGFEVVH